jgi:integrase
LAETVLKKRKVKVAEGKILAKQRPITTTFDKLADAYMKWTQPHEEMGIPACKRSWRSHDLYAIGQLRAFLGGKRLTAITPALVGQYRDGRRSTLSRRKRPVSAATVNRELASLKRMINVACKGFIVLKSGVPHKIRLATSVLSGTTTSGIGYYHLNEFARLCDAAEPWLRPILLVAYHTGMHKGDIRSLRRDQIDLKTGIIRLKSSDLKTGEGRVIPLNEALTTLFKSGTRYLSCTRVFANPAHMDALQANADAVEPRYHATSITHGFFRTCQKAEV